MPGPSACRTSRARNAELCCPALDSEHGSRRPGTTGRSVPGGDGANPSTRSTPRTVPTRQRHRFKNSLQAGRLFLGQGFNTRWQPQRRGCSIGRAVAMAEPENCIEDDAEEFGQALHPIRGIRDAPGKTGSSDRLSLARCAEGADRPSPERAPTVAHVSGRPAGTPVACRSQR